MTDSPETKTFGSEAFSQAGLLFRAFAHGNPSYGLRKV